MNSLCLNYRFVTNCVAGLKRVDGYRFTIIHIYLRRMGLLGMLEVDDTEEQGILGTVK